MSSRSLKVDLHTHVLPREWPDLEKRYGYGGFVRLEMQPPGRARMMKGDHCFRIVEENVWSPERRIEEADRHGVDVQVLSTVPVMFSYWAKPADTLDLSRMLNDHIAGVVQRYPDRFVGLGTLPMQDPELAVAELRRCVNDLGLAGVQIGSHVNDWNLDRTELFQVFSCAEAIGAAVFVHPWDMLGADRMGKYWLPWLVGMPAETALALCSVIFGGVLERAPRLRIAFAHGGGSFPGTIGRIEHGFKVRPDLCAVDSKLNPRSHLGRFYVDSLVHDAEMLRYLIRLIGVERIALGSDYPFPLGEAVPGELIESLEELTPAQRERMLAGTALEFLGLDPETFESRVI
jgi:aminocarboxymuconate-semialdehyde decarboxylase